MGPGGRQRKLSWSLNSSHYVFKNVYLTVHICNYYGMNWINILVFLCLLFCPNITFCYRLTLFIYIFQYLALNIYINPHLTLFTLIWLYLLWISLIWPDMPYSPYTDILLVRLPVQNFKACDRQLIMEILNLKLCDLNLTLKGPKSSKILR